MKRLIPFQIVLTICVGLFMSSACSDSGDKFKRNESNDVTTEPITEDDGTGILKASLFFSRQMANRSEDKSIIIRSSGLTPLDIKRIYIRNFEDCDRTKLRMTPDVGKRLPDGLHEKCQFSISQGGKTRPANPGECPEFSVFGKEECPHYLDEDGPITLNTDEFITYNVRYTASQDTLPEAATLVVETNAFDKEVIEFTLDIADGKPIISVAPQVVSFPAGAAGAEPTRGLLRIINSGTAPLIVTGVDFERLTPAPDVAGDTTEFDLDPTPGINPPLPWTIEEQNGSIQVQIRYSPKDDGEDQANAIFRSNAEGQGPVKILLTSAPVSSALVVQPNPIRFNSQVGATTLFEQVTFNNTGTDKLFVTKIAIEQPNDEYSISADQPDSFQLSAGAEKIVNISYNRKVMEGTNGTLVIETDADNIDGGKLEIPLLKPGSEVTSIKTTPVSVILNNVEAPGMGTADVTILNNGTTPLKISKIEMTDDEDDTRPSNSKITLTAGSVSGSELVLEPGSEHKLTVQVTRDMMDTETLISGFVRIVSNATATPETYIAVSSTPPGQ